jgi:hypothetical protein
MLLLAYVNALSGVSEEMTSKSVLLRVGGMAMGAWVCGQWIVKRSVEVIGLEVKGILGGSLGAIGALLCVVSVYTLFQERPVNCLVIVC